ncbi:MAG: CRISPR-associated endonuclease Cas2 [Firmicutes bacterium]|nr:CRISPR-associated endonuclease Cas2 [Bacillota bacterium]
MMVLITYDVNTEDAAGRKRLRNIAKSCENYGQRVQLSVFECLVDPQQLVYLKSELLSIMNQETDSLRIYYLGKNWSRRVEHFGVKTSYDPEGPLVV